MGQSRPSKPVVSYEEVVSRLRGDETNLRKLFARLAGGDGRVSQPRFFEHVLPDWNFGDTISGRLFEVMGGQQGAGLAYEEFSIAVFIVNHGTRAEKTRLLFNAFDTSASGALKKHDLKVMMSLITRKNQPAELPVTVQDRLSHVMTTQLIDFDAEFKGLFKLATDSLLLVHGSDGKMDVAQFSVYAEGDRDLRSFLDALSPTNAALRTTPPR